MHKIRNTKHIEVLNSLIGTTPFGCMNPLSKKMLWKLCILHNWDRKKVLKDIKDDTYWVHFCDDEIWMRVRNPLGIDHLSCAMGGVTPMTMVIKS